LKSYLAKCHEAFRTGLRAMFDTRCFGRGYPGYWPFGPFVKTYAQIIQRVFPDTPPDIIIPSSSRPNLGGLKYAGIADIDVPKAVVFGDYWHTAEHHYDRFVNLVQENRGNYILSYFPQSLEIWADSPIADRFIYLPPSFDPRIFNDWQMEKAYDVGFLAAGTTEHSPFYPERSAIHQKLLRNKKLKYLWAPHPGRGRFPADHPLVGNGFSKAINSCQLFITTGGTYRNAHAKYVEDFGFQDVIVGR
jgi:hypothetical protein